MGATLAVLGVLVASAPVSGQRLSVQGHQFAVDDTPKFLVFITYFGGMGADNIIADLRFIKSKGFDGIRLWPNSPDGPQLMNADGTLRSDSLARLIFILDRAREFRLIVDVTFTAEHIAGLDAERYKAAITAAAIALRRHENVLFDLQNERNVYGPFGRPLSAVDVSSARAAVKQADPKRILTASNSGTPLDKTSRFTEETRLDVTAYHDPRDANWYQLDRIRSIVDALGANGRPVYFQEPTRFPFPSTDRAEFFQQALLNARAGGAAAWCFHTDLGFNLQGPGMVFEFVLRSREEPDWHFVTWLPTLLQSRVVPSL